MTITQADIDNLIAAHGHYYLDGLVARAFAYATEFPELDVLAVLRMQYRATLRDEESGRGRYNRAIERACRLLVAGWEQGPDAHESATRLLVTREPATAYGILAWREAHPQPGA
jgi:hypothetical protein